MTVKNRCLYSVTSSSPKKSPDQGEESRSQTIGWDPKTEVGTSSRQRKKKKDKVSCWTGFVVDGTKSQVLRVEEDKKYLGQEGAIFFKPVLKIA